MNSIIDKILAVVVIYNKDFSKSETLNSLGNDIYKEGKSLDLFVYDNSNQKQKCFNLQGFNVVEHYYDGRNVGVSSAYNKGVNFAKSTNKEWVLLLDQDTSFQTGALNEYIKNIEENTDINLFSPIIKLENNIIFSPFKLFLKRGIVLKKAFPIRYSLKKYSPVNSGILVKISSFLEAGGYNEKIKLDFSDIEFIRKFSIYNDEFKVINTFCVQDFSNEEKNIENLNKRFVFFCDGAKNCYRKNLYDDFQCFTVVFIRLTMLVLRTKNVRFIKTFYNNYLK